MSTTYLFHKCNWCHVIDTIVQLYVTVGLGMKLKSTSVRSWRWISLRLPRNPRIAARMLLKRANMSFVLMYVMTDAYGPCVFQLFFLPAFCLVCCILVPSLQLLWRQVDWMKTSLCQSLCGCIYPSPFHVVGRPLPGTSQNVTVW